MVDVQGHPQSEVIHARAIRGSRSRPLSKLVLLQSSTPTAGATLVREASALPVQAPANISGLLRDLAQLAVRCQQPDMLLVRIATAIGEAFQAEGCMIVFSTHAQAGLQRVCWLASSDIPPVLESFTPPSDLLRRFAHLEPVSVSDLQADWHSLPTHTEFADIAGWWQPLLEHPSILQVKATLDVTTLFQGSVNGLISVMRSHPHDWTPMEVEALKTISQQVASTLAQMQLEQQIDQQTRYQTVLNQLTLALRNSSDLGEIIQLATDGTAQALQVDRGLLLRLKYLDPLHRNLTSDQLPRARVTVACEWLHEAKDISVDQLRVPGLTADFPHLPASALNQSFWMSDCGLCQQAFIQSPRPMVLNRQLVAHSAANSEALPTLQSVLTRADQTATLMMPLESQGTILGFLVFEDSQPRAWRTQDIELVELVGAQVSTAIIQTETLRQVQALVEKRTAELQHSLAVQARLYERTREQVEQLRHLNTLKDEFLDTVSHELRTPLTSMALAIRMLRQGGVSGDRQALYLEILEQQCTQETNLVNDLLALRALDSKKATFQPEEFSLLALINDLAGGFKEHWATKGLKLELDYPPSLPNICSDRDSLSRVFLELLTNAGKYSEPDSQLHLQMSCQQQPNNQFIVSLVNIGAGISPEELPYIFDKFRRCEGATRNAIQGTGLGLALVQSLVQHLNGTISASSIPTDQSGIWETCFTLVLPQSTEGLKP